MKEKTKLCKRCGINPVPQGRWAYCSEECLGVRSFNRPEEKLGMKQRECRACGVTFVIERAGQRYCEAHLTKRNGKRAPAQIRVDNCKVCGAEFRTNKPNQKYCSEHRAKAWQPNNALALEPMSKVDRQAIINQVLRQYGRKPKEWQ